MNINRLFIASIYVNYKYNEVNAVEYDMFGKFVNYRIVYHNYLNQWVDLYSRRIYKTSLDDTRIGERYISLKEGLIPLTEHSNIDIKGNRISRKKLIRKLSNVNLLNKREDDK